MTINEMKIIESSTALLQVLKKEAAAHPKPAPSKTM
jgi:hypothetical protein